MRVVAMIQVYNERRFIAACIEHLHAQGVEAYVIDNESSDETAAIAESYMGRGVIGIETLAREGVYSQASLCRRQEELAQTLDADWFMHYDADEFASSPTPGQTLAEAIAEVDEAGFNAINLLEFTFVPTVESPDHDHPDFQRTMLWYYPFLRSFPYRLTTWKRQDGPVDLGLGHRVSFPGIKMAPRSLYFRHYMFLSVAHAMEKWVEKDFAAEEVAQGFHGWRARLQADQIQLPSEKELRRFQGDGLLDPSKPLERHMIARSVRSDERPPRRRRRLRLLRRLLPQPLTARLRAARAARGSRAG